MSIRARDYFAAQAEAFGVALPPTLNGEVHKYVSDPPLRIPIHMLDDERIRPQLDPIRRWHREHLGDVGTFLGQCAIERYAKMAGNYSGVRDDNLTRTSRSMFRYLLPKKLSAGRLEDIQLEVVAPEELPAKIVHQLTRNNGYRPTEPLPDSAAYVLTTAHLHAGRPLGRVGFVAYVNVQASETPGKDPMIHLPPAVSTLRLSTNDMLVQSALWQSGATAHAVTEANLRVPLQGGAPESSPGS